jgi:hypothetical protein
MMDDPKTAMVHVAKITRKFTGLSQEEIDSADRVTPHVTTPVANE